MYSRMICTDAIDDVSSRGIIYVVHRMKTGKTNFKIKTLLSLAVAYKARHMCNLHVFV